MATHKLGEHFLCPLSIIPDVYLKVRQASDFTLPHTWHRRTISPSPDLCSINRPGTICIALCAIATGTCPINRSPTAWTHKLIIRHPGEFILTFYTSAHVVDRTDRAKSLR